MIVWDGWECRRDGLNGKRTLKRKRLAFDDCGAMWEPPVFAWSSLDAVVYRLYINEIGGASNS